MKDDVAEIFDGYLRMANRKLEDARAQVELWAAKRESITDLRDDVMKKLEQMQ